MVRNFIADEGGQGMVEYGLIIGLIAIIVIAVFVALGPQIRDMFRNAVDAKATDDARAGLSGIMYRDPE